MKKREEKGITLIALVVTIVVLLILAGISISMLTGENGIITKAQKTKEETRGGTVEEQRDIWRSNNNLDNQTGDNTAQTLDKLLEDLKDKGYLTDDEVKQIKDEGYVVIGSHYIEFDKKEEVDWSKLGPGLYKTGTSIMIKSWQQLIDDGDIYVGNDKGSFIWDTPVAGGRVKLWKINSSIEVGDLIISNEIIKTCRTPLPCGYQPPTVGITGLYIPSSLKEFDGFYGSYPNLSRIEWADGVQKINAYSMSTLFGNNQNITIPNSVTTIDEYAFVWCDNLTNITIPESVTSIGYRAFNRCRSLMSITIPKSVTSIENYAFSECSNLSEIKVAEGNSKYDSRNNCNAIIETSTNKLIAGCKTTVIPDSVTSIGWTVFQNCIGLTSVTIPAGITNISGDYFSGCSNLSEIKVAEGNSKYDSRNNCNAIIETSTNKLVAGCKTTVIPESVTSIGDSAFYECSSLTSIIIPESVTSIEEDAFEYCRSLTSITIPKSITSIEQHAFQSCDSLTTVNYTGTEEEWNKISISSYGNDYLKNATINYNYTE